jgi:hypothetical protein
MIDAARLDLIKRRHGAYGSWAVWAPPTSTPKSKMGDLTVLDELANHALLETLNPGVVMIGLNISRGFPDKPFRNFHDSGSAANDFKIRYAFHDTVFWGAYMTDVIKGFMEPVSGSVTPSHVRDFRGAMTGRADKGIIITTGSFTSEARKEAVRDGAPPIELVDGEKPSNMLEKLELGLRPRQTFEIDTAFFEEYKK